MKIMHFWTFFKQHYVYKGYFCQNRGSRKKYHIIINIILCSNVGKEIDKKYLPSLFIRLLLILGPIFMRTAKPLDPNFPPFFFPVPTRSPTQAGSGRFDLWGPDFPQKAYRSTYSALSFCFKKIIWRHAHGHFRNRSSWSRSSYRFWAGR